MRMQKEIEHEEEEVLVRKPVARRAGVDNYFDEQELSLLFKT